MGPGWSTSAVDHLKNYDTSTTTSTLKVIPIPIEYFILYPSCEWKLSVVSNATTELPTPSTLHTVFSFTAPQTVAVCGVVAAAVLEL